MQIKRLRLSGFKSFVDPAELRIEPGLTGIVGPNGCGKSNLLEALRWTMGENSARSLRGSGMDDVIFAGTATRPARSFAEVSMLVESEGDADGTGTGETEVVRRIERGTGSAYRINGRDVRAKDVALLFADAATGAHSPALVSQGRIGAVIAAKPAERRQMLEEAAGISGLHVRRRDAEQRLRATEANLARLGEVIADQDARIAALKRQARQAERYRALSDDIRIAEARMIFARWRDAARAADAAKAEAAAAEAQVAQRQAALNDCEAAQLAAVAALARLRAAALSAHDAATEARHRLDTLRAEQADVARRIAEAAAARERLAEDRAREGSLASDAAEAIARLGGEAKEIDARLKQSTGGLPLIDAALGVAEREARDAEVALAQALAAQARDAAEIRVAEAARAAARARVERAEREVQRIDAERRALPAAEPMVEARDAARTARANAAQSGDAAARQLDDAQTREQAATDARQRAQAAQAAAAAQLAAADGEAAALRRDLATGDRDRLIDRVRAEAGFERALAAALGDDLDAGLDPADLRQPPGTAPLSAHVEAPAALARRLAQIFVAPGDVGQPLAPGQRLVTPDGVLRRWDGYVARASSAAAAERLERANRLRAIEAGRPDLADAVAQAAAALGTADIELARARQDIAEARRAIDAAETAARAAARDEDRAAAQIERGEAQRVDLSARQARATTELEDARAEHARAVEQVAGLPDGRDAAAQVDALTGQAQARRGAVAAARAERAAADAAIARDRERLAAAQAEQRGWNQRAGEAARRIAEIDRRAAALTDAEASLATRPDQLEQALATAEAQARAAIDAADAARAAEAVADADVRRAETALRAAAEAASQAREARAGAVTRAENQELRRVEMGRLSGERFECPPPLLPERVGFAADTVRTPGDESSRHERLVAERERIGPVNLVAERELIELEEARTSQAHEQAELTQAVNRLRGSIGTLNREGRQRLLAAFEAVNGHFERLYATLFGGGAAHLALIDADDPLEAGLEIMAQPPGKKLQSLTLLSGGEQALTAVALIFALFLTNPAPICVLDEVDAPLDDANIDRFCDLLDHMVAVTRTRYLIVTHNAATMSRMHRLFGVTMVERGVSRLVSVDLGGAETLLAAE
ncbi:chromosome segregation SMC family protein [Sphingomonas sp. CCH21-G11]|uniref:chromosome segregation SMC family protein n=1 Tax=Sphingomonas sp. CCH21-G11 TaxID=1768749 RepID=UPI00082B1205|nr:AAA family ATPase [Sphingomonas sp. CCH21-G11]